MSRFVLSWRIEKDNEGALVRDFLKDREVSKTALTDIKFKGGLILVNNQEVTVRYGLREGDILQIIFPEERPSEGAKGADIPLNIVYEDDYVLVVIKPAGMSTIPSREHPSGSLANGLVGHYEKIGVKSTSHIVTRLDRDTSGLVLIAKHRHVHHLLSKQQKSGLVNRVYEAFADGFFTTAEGKIEEPIGRKDNSIIEREVRLDGQYACTFYSVIKQYIDFAHVKLKLKTGRTHQIRVHLSHYGHPLLGDNLYGGCMRKINRQALHCCQLSFFHPFLNKRLSFTAPLPEDMSKILI